MTVASSEPTRGTVLGVPVHQPVRRLNLVRIRYGVMATGAQAQSDPADVLRFVGTDVPLIGPGEALEVHGATVGPHVSPTLHGAAYVAALKGDPWRPRV